MNKNTVSCNFCGKTYFKKSKLFTTQFYDEDLKPVTLCKTCVEPFEKFKIMNLLGIPIDAMKY